MSDPTVNRLLDQDHAYGSWNEVWERVGELFPPEAEVWEVTEKTSLWCPDRPDLQDEILEPGTFIVTIEGEVIGYFTMSRVEPELN